LIVVMLLLAFLDWLSTRLYARRHSRSMARQRLELLRETLRKSRGDRAADRESPPD
jgi:hypothetical protein